MSECCEAMEYAIQEDYLYHPLQLMQGEKKVDLNVMPPAMYGPLLKPRGKKRKPPIIFSVCPFCGTVYDSNSAPAPERNKSDEQ